jgi:hypothetical protein
MLIEDLSNSRTSDRVVSVIQPIHDEACTAGRRLLDVDPPARTLEHEPDKSETDPAAIRRGHRTLA